MCSSDLISDLLPGVASSGSWSSSSSTGATAIPSTGTGDIAAVLAIPAGGSITFTYTVATKPNPIGLDGTYADLVNVVKVTPPAGQGTTVSSTDTDTAKPTVDLAVSKSRTSGLPVAGDPVTYQIVVSNKGPSSLVTFKGVDTTSPALLVPTYSVSTGSYDPVSGVWTAGVGDTFDPGETVIFTLTGTVPASAVGPLVNTATATPPAGVIDPDPSNNTSTVTDTIVIKPVLTVTKDNFQTEYVPGKSTTYTIVVTNSGSSDLVGGTISDLLPGVA